MAAAVSAPTVPPEAKRRASRTALGAKSRDVMIGIVQRIAWLFQLFWKLKTKDAQAPVQLTV